MFTIWAFSGIENMHGVYRGEDCMKKFCESLKENAMKIINLETKKIILLANKYLESYASQAICHVCKKNLKKKMH